MISSLGQGSLKGRVVLLLVFSLSFPLVEGALNPAGVYCDALGYEYSIKDGQGFCILPDGSEVDAWRFLQGKEGVEYSYCRMEGLEIKTVRDPEKCIRFLLDECAVCVLENGTEVEVTELMGLSFEETTCGDGVCGLPENFKTCPQDCPSGSWDAYCDGIADGKCDQDCVDFGRSEEDPDCPVCGNGICEEGENHENCPEDCPKPAVCGNGVCEEGESSDNCCSDCGCPEGEKCFENRCILDLCGNDVCEPKFGEDYKTCPQDCPSGSRDAYCDGIADGKCDPDCSEEEDVDCMKPEDNTLTYAIVLVVIVLIGIVVARSRRE